MIQHLEGPFLYVNGRTLGCYDQSVLFRDQDLRYLI